MILFQILYRKCMRFLLNNQMNGKIFVITFALLKLMAIMRNNTFLTIFISLIAAFACSSAHAQTTFDGVVSVDKTIHDFGDIFIDDGAVTCDYTFKNIGSKPMLILSAVSSCGCTDAEWTREPIAPGKTGKVTATFKNEDGPYPFDKTITVYVSEMKKPVVLHLRGSVHENSKPISENYPIIIGNLGLKRFGMKAGNLSQRESKSGNVVVANIGIAPMKVEFKNVSEGLTVAVFPNPVPPKSTATLSYTIKADRNHWGKNWYYATPVIDGHEYKAIIKKGMTVESDNTGEVYSESNTRIGAGKSEIAFWAVTKENFNMLSESEKNEAPNPSFTNSTVSFGSVAAGTKTTLTFNYTNKGKSTSKFYKLDADCHNVKVKSMSDTEAGKKGTITLELDTTGLPKGDIIIALNVFTNSCLRPVISLQLTGKVL